MGDVRKPASAAETKIFDPRDLRGWDPRKGHWVERIFYVFSHLVTKCSGTKAFL